MGSGAVTRPTLRVACAQLCSGEDIAENLDAIEALVARAAGEGADLVALPENATQLAPDRIRVAQAEPIDGPQVERLRGIAAEHGVGLLVGSFAERSDDPTRSYNTTVALGRGGELLATYRKAHLFDVDVDADTRLRESASVMAGAAEPVVARFDGWGIGLSICYDLRFPEWYRALVDAGADVLAVPSAFTFRTGTAHWHVLLRARAVENQCWVLAAAQVGRHYGGRESYGHAMVVHPWGDVVAEMAAGTGYVMAVMDHGAVDDVRRRLPALTHRRLR